VSTLAIVTNPEHPVEVRAHKPGGITYRTLPARDVPAEVAALAAGGRFSTIELRAVGAPDWRRVGP